MRDIDNVLYTNQKHMMRLLEMLHRRLMYHYKGHIIKIVNCLWINKHHSSEFIYYACKKIIVFLNYIIWPIPVNVSMLLIYPYNRTICAQTYYANKICIKTLDKKNIYFCIRCYLYISIYMKCQYRNVV